MKKQSVNGIIFYRGPSMLDGQEIVGIATFSSANVKTGNMIQTYILPANAESVWDWMKSNQKSTLADSICGVCPHRRDLGGACYVMPHGVNAVYRSFKAGKYPDATKGNFHEYASHFLGRAIRFGAYGDPMAIPAAFWRVLSSVADGHTGYTHQMAHKAVKGTQQAEEIAALCMVSCDTVKQAEKYQQKGYKTFRVAATGDNTMLASEIQCPAAPEKGITCLTCKNRCDTTGKSVVIEVHGALSKRFDDKFRII